MRISITKLANIRKLVFAHIRSLGNRCYTIVGTRYAKWLLFTFFVVTAFFWAWCLMFPSLGNSYSPDSHACYLVGKNVFDGLGWTTFAIRDLHEAPAWPIPSRSFPPLFPFLVGFVDWVSGLGIYSGVVVNLFVLIGTLIAVFLLCRALVGRYWFLLAFAFPIFVSLNPYYLQEIFTARSIPVTMLFSLLFLFTFTKTLAYGVQHRRYEILTGVFMCLVILARFDQLLFILSSFPFALIAYKAMGLPIRKALIKTGYLLAGFSLSYLPWAIHSIATFGTPFAANNTITVLNIFQKHSPLCFWASGAEPETLFDNLDLWLDDRLDYVVRNWHALENVTENFIYIVPFVIVPLWSRITKVSKAIILMCVLQGIALFFSVSLTPFPDLRYWSQIHLSLFLIFGIALVDVFRKSNVKALVPLIIGALMACFLVTMCCKEDNRNLLKNFLFEGKVIPQSVDKKISYYREIERFYKPHFEDKSKVWARLRETETFTSYLGVRTVTMLHNIKLPIDRDKNFIAWLDKWKVDYIYVTKVDEKRLRGIVHEKYVIAGRKNDKLLDARKVLQDLRHVLYEKEKLKTRSEAEGDE